MVTLKVAGFAVASLAVLAAAGAAQAQVSATASTSATVLGPLIQISKSRDMNLGVIARPSSGTYTVTIEPGGDRSGAGGAGGQVVGGAGQTALFDVAGESNRAFTITAPSTITLSVAGGGANREVTFTPSYVTSATLAVDPSGYGEREIEVHGQLAVPAGTETGAYSGSLPLTVQYQ